MLLLLIIVVIIIISTGAGVGVVEGLRGAVVISMSIFDLKC